eukprot:scaffold108005_cov37-Tisochrysis_lutea.AAC.2
MWCGNARRSLAHIVCAVRALLNLGQPEPKLHVRRTSSREMEVWGWRNYRLVDSPARFEGGGHLYRNGRAIGSAPLVVFNLHPSVGDGMSKPETYLLVARAQNGSSDE